MHSGAVKAADVVKCMTYVLSVPRVLVQPHNEKSDT